MHTDTRECSWALTWVHVHSCLCLCAWRAYDNFAANFTSWLHFLSLSWFKKKSEPPFKNQISCKNLYIQLLLKNETAVLSPVPEGHPPTVAHRLWPAVLLWRCHVNSSLSESSRSTHLCYLLNPYGNLNPWIKSQQFSSKLNLILQCAHPNLIRFSTSASIHF